jgi:N-acetylglucosamine kinase-like BadF-type ATPase
MTTIYLGIDAGNSKTVVLACLGSGRVAGAARSGCGDIYGAAGEAAAVREVLSAADAALADAGAGRGDVAAAAFRLAGVDWPEDRQFWDAVLTREWPGLTRSILNDGYAAIRSGEPSGVGVAVNAGTSAAIAARGHDGTTWDMGWWGQHAMGALGLVSEALKAVYLAHLGAAPETGLGPALLDFYGLANLTELNQWFTRRHQPAGIPEKVRAARVVTDTARRGDPVAAGIVDEQGRRFAFYAEIAARQARLRRTGAAVPVVMSGSVLTERDSPVAAALAAHLPRLLPEAELRPATLPPVAGAALDALAEGGVAVTRPVVSGLAATIPAPAFFRT